MPASKISQEITLQIGPGRERTLTTGEAIIEALRAGAFVEDAAESVGVAKQTIYSWLSRGEEHAGEDDSKIPESQRVYVEFMRGVEKARAQGRVWHVANLRRHAEDDWRASAFFLERTDSSRWGKRDKHEHSGQQGLFQPAAVDLSKLTDEEAEELELLLGKAQDAEPAT